MTRKVYFIPMFSSEIRKLLIQVISSWQVIAVTVVLIIYISIVNYVARIRSRPSSHPIMPSAPKEKKQKPEKPVHTDSDDLGLEEETK